MPINRKPVDIKFIVTHGRAKRQMGFSILMPTSKKVADRVMAKLSKLNFHKLCQ